MPRNPNIADPTSPAQPPDGGWGWVVVFGSFMTNFILGGGVASSFGIFITAFASEYGGTSSLIGSLFLGMIYGTGPIAGSLVNHYGCRLVSLIGILMTSCSFAVSYWAPNLTFLCFSIGIFAGMGLGFTYLPAVVILSHWFHARRSFVTGLTSCGIGLGSFSLAPVLKICIALIGWRYSVLVVAGAVMLCAVFSVTYRSPPERASEHELNSSVQQGTDESQLRGGQFSQDGLVSTESIKESNSTQLSALIQNDMTEFGVSKFPQAEHVKTDALGDSTVQGEGKGDADSAEKPRKPPSMKKFSSLLRSTLDYTLFTNVAFMYCATAHLLASFSQSIPYVLFDKLAASNNVKDPSGFIIGSLGISGTASRCILGYFSDKKCINRAWLLSFSVFLAGIVIGSIAHSFNLPALIACAVIFGTCNGIYGFLTPVVLVDFLGFEKLNSAFGIILLFQGVGTILGPPTVEIVSSTEGGSYLAGCWLAGAVGMAAGIMFLFVRIVEKVCSISGHVRTQTNIPVVAVTK